jgi:hypothetical protein
MPVELLERRAWDCLLRDRTGYPDSRARAGEFGVCHYGGIRMAQVVFQHKSRP